MPLDSFKLLCRGSRMDTWERLLYRKLIIVFTPNLEFSPYSEVIHGNTTFKQTKGYHRLKKNGQLFNLMFLIFLSFSSPREKN